ncbi:hypothetical protein BDZ89DRAFT_1070891 [Hymenopellis radicata]|nr:hypothetical protein BDZ89DRAFT_1070891 [Hymenopellis radicata]
MPATVVPPIIANQHVICMKCFKEDGTDTKLSKCTRCKRVSYCGSGCQKDDWAQHKAICKALHASEQEPMLQMTLEFSLSDVASTDVAFLNELGMQATQAEVQFVSRARGHPLAVNVVEQNLVCYQSRCIGCTRTDRMLRMSPSSSRYSSLATCPDCKMAFYCCEDHWTAMRAVHAEQPCEDGHDGLTQCQLNREIREDVKRSHAHPNVDPEQPFAYCPARVQDAWASLDGASWTSEYKALLETDLGKSEAAWLRAASEQLSFPMTILRGLELLHNDDAWTKKETLTIHIIGAYQAEVLVGHVFEEVLHRVPGIKTLKLVLTGPQLPELVRPFSTASMSLDVCPKCKKAGRTRIQVMRRELYHELKNEDKPDLAVAFNTGLSEESPETWPETIKVLVDRKIPSVFTSYNREEAVAEGKILAKHGATLIKDGDMSSGSRNQWGSMLMKPEPCKIFGFFSVNGWIAGAFR